jgi:hypothetical protein
MPYRLCAGDPGGAGCIGAGGGARAQHPTVGEEPDFLAAGGMVALVRDGTKVRLRFNLPAIRAGRLEVSSKLLRLGATP